MNQLEVLRESLGQCDEIILDALLMRNRIVEDIMVYKEAHDLPVLQPEQEAKQKGWLEARMEGRRHKKEVNDVFASITQNSKRIQSRNLLPPFPQGHHPLPLQKRFPVRFPPFQKVPVPQNTVRWWG